MDIIWQLMSFGRSLVKGPAVWTVPQLAHKSMGMRDGRKQQHQRLQEMDLDQSTNGIMICESDPGLRGTPADPILLILVFFFLSMPPQIFNIYKKKKEKKAKSAFTKRDKIKIFPIKMGKSLPLNMEGFGVV